MGEARLAGLDWVFRWDERDLGTAGENAAFSATGLSVWLCAYVDKKYGPLDTQSPSRHQQASRN